MKERHLRGLDTRDIEEFGFDDDDDLISVPRLIALLPEREREPYRERMRAHVRHQTGRPDVTWKQYMNGWSKVVDRTPGSR